MIACSPGLLQGCFYLLEVVSRNTSTAMEIMSGFPKLGVMPPLEVIETTQALNWVSANESHVLTPTPTGLRLLLLKSYETKLRQALLDYIEIERPAWLQNASFGRARVLSFTGSEIEQVFIEANLVTSTEDSVVQFWDDLAARARGQRNDRMTEIGRLGERLTITHETQRTGRVPKWTAVDNNADGYDVLSIVSPEDTRFLSIEVKASTQGMRGSFHLTRNEWDRAIESPCYTLHLWDIKNIASPNLAIVPIADITKHIPTDCGVGEWENVAIPFMAFQSHFNPSMPASLSTSK